MSIWGDKENFLSILSIIFNFSVIGKENELRRNFCHLSLASSTLFLLSTKLNLLMKRFL